MEEREAEKVVCKNKRHQMKLKGRQQKKIR